MGVKVDVLGFRYDDSEPAFMEIEGGFYYHLNNRKLFNKDEFDQKLVDEGKTFGDGELGYPSFWRMVFGADMLASFVPPDGSAQMNVNVTKTPAGVDDTGQITVVGGPTDEALIVRIETKDSTSATKTDTAMVVEMIEQETADEVAARIAALAFDPNLASVSAVGPVITFTPSAGGSIDIFTSGTDRPL